MNKNRKGFTLVELLAVIIVLAMLALIVRPMITSTLDSAKKNSFKQSFKSVIKAAKIYQAQDDFTDCIYFSFSNDVDEITVRDGKEYHPLKMLEVKGKFPSEGEIRICSDIITVNASNGSYSGTYDGENITITDENL